MIDAGGIYTGEETLGCGGIFRDDTFAVTAAIFTDVTQGILQVGNGTNGHCVVLELCAVGVGGRHLDEAMRI